ncbi:MAG: GNAT family N-acetyltransferase, partial [Armatimonadota bacterium]|nr:GNAT family N-acetyltransferase [Armatimonadota bacterium]
MNDLVTIQPVKYHHAEQVQQYASDERVAATTNIPHPYPAGGAKAFVERAIAGRETGSRYAFAVLTDGSFAGVITLNTVDRHAGTAELDYWVAATFWNSGVGTAAISEAIQYAFDELGLSMLASACLLENVASVRVLEKNGFEKVGEFINDGKYGTKFMGRRMSQLELHRSARPEPDHSVYPPG